MDGYAQKLNDLLVGTYELVNEIEERMLGGLVHYDLNIRELHMIEYIASDGGRAKTISDIAQNAGITAPSVTVAIKKLEKKGYVEKTKSESDGRIVYVVLTRMGEKIDAAHRYFHKRMIINVAKELSEQEKEVLVSALSSLDTFLVKSLSDMKKNPPKTFSQEKEKK